MPALCFHLSVEHFHFDNPLHFKLDVFKISLLTFFLWVHIPTFYSSPCGLCLIAVDETSWLLSISPSSPQHSIPRLPPSSLILPPRCGADLCYCIPAPLLGLQFRSSSARPGSYSSLQMGISSSTPSPSSVHPACNCHSKPCIWTSQNRASESFNRIILHCPQNRSCSFRMTFKALNPQTLPFLTGLTLPLLSHQDSPFQLQRMSPSDESRPFPAPVPLCSLVFQPGMTFLLSSTYHAVLLSLQSST